MLNIPSEIEGMRAYYGDVCVDFEKQGFHLCGSWEYYAGFFDSILHMNEGTTVYLRLPARVVEGKLDRDDALLEFGRPFLIKHIVHTGIDENAELGPFTAFGLNQFQAPVDSDDRIEHENRWVQAGEQAIGRIKQYLQ